RMGAREHAFDDADLFLADQTFGFVDADLDLALRVRLDRNDLVLAANAALLVDEIDGDVGAYRRGNRAARRERTGQIVNRADADRFTLRLRARPTEAHYGCRSRSPLQQRPA